MIAIIDYGMGNLLSVQKGLERVGYRARVVQRPAELAGARGLVLPGVGAFGDAMQNLTRSGMADALRLWAAEGRPLLGICLGLQLFFAESEEGGPHRGLGLLPGRVVRLPEGVKVPHMGWNTVSWRGAGALRRDVPEGAAFYFVHSYYAQPADPGTAVGLAAYGVTFAAAVARGNLWGLQFHPEKSSALGLQILKNFGELVESCSSCRP